MKPRFALELYSIFVFSEQKAMLKSRDTLKLTDLKKYSVHKYSALQRPFMKQNGVYSNQNKVS